VSDKLGNFQGVLEAFFALSFIAPGVYLEFAWWLVESAVDLYRLEELIIVLEPCLLLLCDLYWVEPANPIGIRPATAAHQDRQSTCNIEGRRDIDFLVISFEKVMYKAKPFFVRQLMDKVGVEMSKDCNLIAGTEVSSSRKAAINVIHEIDEDHFEEPEGESKECNICGELVDQACLLFIGRNGDGQDLFACGKCCNSGYCED